MTYLAYAIIGFARLVLRVLDAALLIRALMSWIMPDESGTFARILCAITEPVLLPFRALFSRFEFARSCPIDLSYIAACIAVAIVAELLPTVYL